MYVCMYVWCVYEHWYKRTYNKQFYTLILMHMYNCTYMFTKDSNHFITFFIQMKYEMRCTLTEINLCAIYLLREVAKLADQIKKNPTTRLRKNFLNFLRNIQYICGCYCKAFYIMELNVEIFSIRFLSVFRCSPYK